MWLFPRKKEQVFVRQSRTVEWATHSGTESWVLGKQAIPGYQVVRLWIWTSWLWAKPTNPKLSPASLPSSPTLLAHSLLELSANTHSTESMDPGDFCCNSYQCSQASLTLCFFQTLLCNFQKKPWWTAPISGLVLLLLFCQNSCPHSPSIPFFI